MIEPTITCPNCSTEIQTTRKEYEDKLASKYKITTEIEANFIGNPKIG